MARQRHTPKGRLLITGTVLLILLVVSKARRFDGENTWFYFLWYGLGRSWIEGLRTDSLYLFDWTILGQPIRVSQALSVVMAVVAAWMLFYNIRIKKRSAEDLLVNQRRRLAIAAADAEALASLSEEMPEEAAEPAPQNDEVREETRDGSQD